MAAEARFYVETKLRCVRKQMEARMSTRGQKESLRSYESTKRHAERSCPRAGLSAGTGTEGLATRRRRAEVLLLRRQAALLQHELKKRI